MYLCSVLPCDRFSWRPEAGDRSSDVVELNKLLKRYADSVGIMYVDYFSAMANERNALKDGLSSDGCHPTAAGYEIMERIIGEALGGK